MNSILTISAFITCIFLAHAAVVPDAVAAPSQLASPSALSGVTAGGIVATDPIPPALGKTAAGKLRASPRDLDAENTFWGFGFGYPYLYGGLYGGLGYGGYYGGYPYGGYGGYGYYG